jgi:hypothetical protein
MSAQFQCPQGETGQMDVHDRALFRAFTAERDGLLAQTSKASLQEQASLHRRIAVCEMLLERLREGKGAQQ